MKEVLIITAYILTFSILAIAYTFIDFLLHGIRC